MKVNIYIEKKNFDQFFIWFNRIQQGLIDQCPVLISHTPEELSQPLQVVFDGEEYANMCDVLKSLKDIQEKMGITVAYKIQPWEEDKILIKSIMENARRHDIETDVIQTALEIMSQIPGITPLEAMIISEKEWINVGKSIGKIDI